jgi:membrane fusion protein, multidrug efflux system
MSNEMRRGIAGILSLVGLVLLISIVVGIRSRPVHGDEDDEKEKAIQAPSRISVQNGQVVITLDSATEDRLGLRTEVLHESVTQQQVQALGLVLSVDSLANLRSNYIATKAKVEADRAKLDAIQNESQRLQSLYQNDQNASLKALQAQDALVRSGEADMETAERSLAAQKELVRLQWGPVVSKWVETDTPERTDPPELDRILMQQELLVQVSLPPGLTAGPTSALLESPNGKIAQAMAVSPFPRVDPRTQANSFLYRMPVADGFAPGVSVSVRLPVGPAVKGVLVPDSAVVWWQGTPWFYVETVAGHFVRRQVPTNVRVEHGWFVTSGVVPGDKIVTVGSQDLLSEEFRSQIRTED